MLTVIVAGIIGAASVITALGVLARFTGLGETWKDFRNFLKDWKGEPPRPGFTGRPSFPERMTAQEEQAEKIEQRTAALNHDMRGEIASRLILVEEQTAQLQRNGGTSLADVVHRIEATLDEVKAQTARTGERVTEHRRRNDDTIAALRKYLTDRLDKIEINHAHAEAMRASLHELGIDVEPPEVGRG